MAKTVRKAVIYEEDLAKSTGSGSATASRGTSTGGTQTLTKLGAGGAWFFNNLNNILFVDGVKYVSAQAAHDALPASGGTIFVPNGSTPFGAANTTPLVITKHVHVKFDMATLTYAGTGAAISSSGVDGVIIEGSGRGNTTDRGTFITVTGTGVNGIDLKGQANTISDLDLAGPGSGTGKGIIFTSNNGQLQNLWVHGFGGNGVEIDGTRGNSNNMTLRRVRSSNNGGDGFNVFGADANVVHFDGTDGSTNSSANYRIASGCHQFSAAHSEAAGGGTGFVFLGGSPGASYSTGSLYSEAVAPETTAISFASGSNNNILTFISATNPVYTDSGLLNQVYASGAWRNPLVVGAKSGSTEPILQFTNPTNTPLKITGQSDAPRFLGGGTSLGFIFYASQGGTGTFGRFRIRNNQTDDTESFAHDTSNKTTESGRYKANFGTALVAGDFALSAGWGSTASVGSIRGTDQFHEFTITSAGTGQGASPTVTLTYKDGTWTTAPIVRVNRQEFANQAAVTFTVTTQSATQYVLTFNGTPVAAETYRICVFVGGI